MKRSLRRFGAVLGAMCMLFLAGVAIAGTSSVGIAPAPAAAFQGTRIKGARMEQTTTPSLSYHGGKVISNVRIVQVLYGSGNYDPHVDGTTSPSLPYFYQDVVNDCTIDWLSEYDTPTQSIGSGSYYGMLRITPSPSRNGASISDGQIRDEIADQIDGHGLPQPDANTLYMIHFRSGQTVTASWGNFCTVLCGYHSSFSHNGHAIYYSVLPDVTTCPNCGGTYQDQMSVAFHEIIEAITDPVVGKGWVDDASGDEIADICNWQKNTFVGHDGETYTLQEGWSNARASCYSAPQPLTLQSPSDGVSCVNVNGQVRWTTVAGATGYHVVMATSPSLKTGVVEDATVSGTSYGYGPLQNLTRYYWKVTVTNGCVPSTSSVYSFVTDPPPPTVPILQIPADGASGLPTSGVLDWADVPGAAGYNVSVRCPSGEVVASGGSTVSQFQYDLGSATYTWRVDAYDHCGQFSAASSTRTFTVGAGFTCAVPALESPADNDTCQARAGVIRWQAVPGASGYIIQLSKKPDLCDKGGTDIAVPTNEYAYSNLDPGAIYHWKVKENCPCAAFSVCRSFTTVPDIGRLRNPHLASPSDGSREQSASGTLAWDTVDGAACYVVQLGTACGSGTESLVTGPSFSYAGLDQNTIYSWRVKAQDSCGQQSEYSACFTFQTEALTGIDRYYIPSGLSYAVGETLVTIPVHAENLTPMREFDFGVTIDTGVFQYVGWTLAGTRAEGAANVDVHYDANHGRVQVNHAVFPPSGQCPPSIPAGDGDVFEILVRVRTSAAQGLTLIQLDASPHRFVACDGHNTTPALFSNNAEIRPGTTAAPSIGPIGPASLSLEAPVPNPSRGTTSMRFGNSLPQRVRISVLDLSGREVRQLVEGDVAPGWHVATWDGRDADGRRVAAGVYLIRLAGMGQTRTRRLVVVP